MFGTVIVAFSFLLSELCPFDCVFTLILYKHSCKQHDCKVGLFGRQLVPMHLSLQIRTF